MKKFISVAVMALSFASIASAQQDTMTTANSLVKEELEFPHCPKHRQAYARHNNGKCDASQDIVEWTDEDEYAARSSTASASTSSGSELAMDILGLLSASQGGCGHLWRDSDRAARTECEAENAYDEARRERQYEMERAARNALNNCTVDQWGNLNC